MADIKDIIAYFCMKYPHKKELAKARLTKMVYLADWKSALNHKVQISSIEWIYNHYGPYVDDVIDTVQSSDIFNIESTLNTYGNSKDLVSLIDQSYEPKITDDEKEILDYVIEISSPKYWNDFIELVYSTYPVVSNEKYSKLELVKLAQEYQKKKHHQV